ncbi:GerMN domain-containing protein [Nostoc sp. UHCC 0870]|uniref:GerMN domain-containing protein n=1 Tax=Nostoc sp. UHCC 0870 TaxID=2914041 RepID=UPI001EDF7C4E|nr:GerMN domain-containing protein [Nostoc sp. UHCC 0870]UKO99826.1 GerMN domain-containing protein [Nostoc sp. UHCC 0870]
MISRCLLPFLMIAIAASISSCASNLPETSTTPTPTQSMAQLRVKHNNIKSPSDTSKAASGKMVNVTLYISDIQCQEFVPQKVTVPAVESLTNTVGKIIQEQDTADFSLSGYRVTVNNGVATVDLRLSPQSKRNFISLSNCEQFALFGSVRKTLTNNSQWKIKEVRFTEKGEPIVM